MSQTFILQNQDKLFFGKNKEWVDGYDANAVFKTPHKDEAVNQMFEITSKDYQQRVKVISCTVDEKALPVIEADIMPSPLPKVAKSAKGTDDLFGETTDCSESRLSENQAQDKQTLSYVDASTDEPKLQSSNQ